tara:strand:- start:99 stop:206 length:108 start_codon:yes stop_codon:yes gene_type:complete
MELLTFEHVVDSVRTPEEIKDILSESPFIQLAENL